MGVQVYRGRQQLKGAGGLEVFSAESHPVLLPFSFPGCQWMWGAEAAPGRPLRQF